MMPEPNIKDLKKQADRNMHKRIRELEDRMTAKQLRFAQYYIIDPNAAEAARKAKYAQKHAREMGYENLTKPHIAEYIEIFVKMQEDERIATAQEVLQTLTKVMRGEIETTIQKAKTKGAGQDAEREIIIEKHRATNAERTNAARILGTHFNLFDDKLIDLRNATIELTIDGVTYGDDE
jgi:phage terminase small subunit